MRATVLVLWLILLATSASGVDVGDTVVMSAMSDGVVTPLPVEIIPDEPIAIPSQINGAGSASGALLGSEAE